MTAEFKNKLLVYGGIYAAWLCLMFTLTGGWSDPSAWMHSWMYWDADWYKKIWDLGYPKDNPKQFAFPPGYSILIGELSRVLPLDFHATAMVVNVYAYGLAMAIMAELMGELMDVPPVPLFCLALTSPAAYVIFSAYSDSLFALMLWAALYLALLCPFGPRARVMEFLLLLAMPWMRLVGFSLAIWVLLRRWAVAGLALSMGGWLALNYHFTGDAWYFVKAQHMLNLPEGTFIDGFNDTARGAWYVIASHGYIGGWDRWVYVLKNFLLPLLYLALLAGAAIWFCFRGQWLVGLTILAMLLLSHDMIYWRSEVRYDLPMLPCIFVPLLSRSKRRRSWQAGLSTGVVLGVVGLAQFILLVHFAISFMTGAWVF